MSYESLYTTLSHVFIYALGRNYEVAGSIICAKI
jgi:hypothetical protein